MSAEPNIVEDGVLSLVLRDDQVTALRGQPGRFFALLSPGSYPESGGRMVLHFIPCGYGAARAACEVAMGTRKPGRKISTPPHHPA